MHVTEPGAGAEHVLCGVTSDAESPPVSCASTEARAPALGDWARTPGVGASPRADPAAAIGWWRSSGVALAAAGTASRGDGERGDGERGDGEGENDE